MKIKRICVIGSGNGAFAVAGNLALEGRSVILCDCAEFRDNLQAVARNNSCIEVTGAAYTGTARLESVTEDLAAAMSSADVTLVVIPSFALADTARRIAAAAPQSAKVFLCAGSTGGALECAHIFQTMGVSGIRLGEFSSLPFGCRKTGPTSVNVATLLRSNLFAAFPAEQNKELFADAEDLFSVCEPAADVLECSLNNENIALHGPIILLNAAGTENNPDNHHYRDGISPSTAKALDKIDAERQALCRAMGYPAIPVVEAAVRKGYCPQLESTSYETWRKSADLMSSPGPCTLNHRYLTEDIPFSMLVVSEVGRIAGIPTPLTDAVITLCGALMNEDYFQKGRTATALGIDNMDLASLSQYLKTGRSPRP